MIGPFRLTNSLNESASIDYVYYIHTSGQYEDKILTV